jgi:sulfur relay protein TusB/DsrH
MLVMVKSAPDTSEGKRGIQLARDMAANIVLIQNGVYYAQKKRLEAFTGKAYFLDEDMKLRGISPDMTGPGVKGIDYEGLVDLIAENEKVVGMF